MKNKQLKFWLVMLSGFFLFGCSGNSKKDQIKQESDPQDPLGWSDERIENLLSECYTRFKADNREDAQANPEAYCNCFVDKITMSVKYEDHVEQKEETVLQYDEYSKTCRRLTSDYN